MAARKKSPGAAEFTVVLEEMRSHFKVFGEALGGVREELADVREELADVRQDVAGVRRDLELVKVAVLENSREIRDLRVEVHDVRGAVTRIEQALETKVDRDEVEGIVARVVAR